MARVGQNSAMFSERGQRLKVTAAAAAAPATHAHGDNFDDHLHNRVDAEGVESAGTECVWGGTAECPPFWRGNGQRGGSELDDGQECRGGTLPRRSRGRSWEIILAPASCLDFAKQRMDPPTDPCCHVFAFLSVWMVGSQPFMTNTLVERTGWRKIDVDVGPTSS